jgi:NAD(P)-dependent dehydrogenase (short-subunit alcohol dehydrogenase family)
VKGVGIQYDLGGRRVLVIGGSSGVGRAVGLAASRAGARVAFAARRRELLETAVAEAGNGAIAVPCDVTASDCTKAIDEAAAALGGIDALVYATGMSPLRMLEQASHEEWRRVLDVNLIGASQVTAAAVPHLRACDGRAVYVSSYAVRQSLPGLGLYRVSKVALDALIECWRMEHPDVDFTRIVVGNTGGTEFAKDWGGEAIAGAMKVWVSRNLFPAATMMTLPVLAEAILSVIAVRGYVDDIAIMSRMRDAKAEGSP